MGSNLYIYCIKYQNWDEIFIFNEIRYLSGYFNNIEIIPLNNSSELIKNELPQNTKLNLGLSDYLKQKAIKKFAFKYLSILFNYRFLRLSFRINPLKIKALFNYFVRISEIKYWCQENLTNNCNTIHYTYWYNEVTSALCFSDAIASDCKIVSRAHRFDLYDEFGSEITNLFKKENLKYIDRIFTVSKHGMEYLKIKFPDYFSKFEVSKLGTPDPNFICIPSESELIRVFSCSLFVKAKRIDLIIESLNTFSEIYPGVKIEWLHCGSGLLESEMHSLAKRSLEGRVRYKFLGFIPNSEIYRIYKEEKISILLNVSDSEGIPVSFMEAQSCGVPVIATTVGGTPEIVNNENGLLLPADPVPDEISNALYDVYSNKEKWFRKREISRKNWENNFNAEKNYNDFANQLVTLS
jgi:glycosyltransferase involved in cell wall biosynthesis